jgi:16S rRNA (guanine527-N7)-methyltransferase
VDALIAPRFDRIIAQLSAYAAEIELFNPLYKLVKADTREELVVKHLLDSLAPLGHICRALERIGPTGALLADVGSGPGLPGLPLAIALHGASVTLIERMGRRTAFLRDTLAVLGLHNGTVLEAEAEKAPPGIFDMVLCRAFHPLDKKVFKTLTRLVRPGGCIAAYKGRREKAEAEFAALAEAGFLRFGGGGGGSFAGAILPLTVPFLDEERHLALLWSDGCRALALFIRDIG